ncbi:MAG TPA: tetratricopeptide repeat protein [Bacteroidota bacterium]|nr:tetratricopeptide repeat protein [Bacteroidota bacterium]
MKPSRIDELRRYLKTDPCDSFSHYAIALEYKAMGKISDAIHNLEEVLAIDPNYLPAYQQLGSIFVDIGRKDDALKILESGIRIAKSIGDAHTTQEMQEIVDELET